MVVGPSNNHVQRASPPHMQCKEKATCKGNDGVGKIDKGLTTLFGGIQMMLELSMKTHQQVKVMEVWIMIILIGTGMVGVGVRHS